MNRFSCGYCTRTFKSEEFPCKCPNCGRLGPFDYVITFTFEIDTTDVQVFIV